MKLLHKIPAYKFEPRLNSHWFKNKQCHSQWVSRRCEYICVCDGGGGWWGCMLMSPNAVRRFSMHKITVLLLIVALHLPASKNCLSRDHIFLTSFYLIFYYYFIFFETIFFLFLYFLFLFFHSISIEKKGGVWVFCFFFPY